MQIVKTVVKLANIIKKDEVALLEVWDITEGLKDKRGAYLQLSEGKFSDVNEEKWLLIRDWVIDRNGIYCDEDEKYSRFYQDQNWLIDNNSLRNDGGLELILLNISGRPSKGICAIYKEWKNMDIDSMVVIDENTTLENLSFDEWKKNVELLTGHYIDWSKLEDGKEDDFINKNKNPIKN